MKKILVPTDFSETANKARDYAVQLAQELNAEVMLLNSCHIPYASVHSGVIVNVDEISKASEQLMKEQLEYLNLNYSNIKFRSSCTSGLVVDSVRRICDRGNIDFVIMGSTGTTGFIGNMLGNNTSSLIGLIETPIIAVPSNATIKFPKKIIVANDLMTTGEEKLFKPLKEIATKTNSTIDFLFVVDEEHKMDYKIQRLKASNFDDKFGVQYHPFHFRNDENIEDGILDYINNHDADLLTVVSHQRNFWQELFHKSISKSITKHAKLPILILSE
jgi:nucleotide-binding universal stress UspA family protein